MTAAFLVVRSSEATAPVASAIGPDETSAICAPSVQFLGFSDALDKTSFAGFDVAGLSGLTYDPRQQRYYTVADRAGPIPSHAFTLDVPLDGEAVGTPRILDVTVLRTMTGDPLTGFDMDGEGIAILNDELLIASEGGAAPEDQPTIRRFSRAGEHRGDLLVPQRFLIGSNNLMFESLARSPSGDSLFTANERPLPAMGASPEDGQTPDRRNRIRILRYAAHSSAEFLPSEQFFYLTEPDRVAGDVGVVELIAITDTDLLVLERGYVADEGNTVRLFHVFLEGAPDVSEEPTLASPGLRPLAKTLLFDLADCPSSGAMTPPGAVQPNPLLDNFEAMSLGPHLEGGWQLLLLLSDDNGNPTQVTRLVGLAIFLPNGLGSADSRH